MHLIYRDTNNYNYCLEVNYVYYNIITGTRYFYKICHKSTLYIEDNNIY